MECKPLKEVAQIIMGQSPDSSSYNEVGEGLPFFQGNADFGVMYPSERIWCNQPKKIANENDILISVRAPIGALNYANKKCCIGRGLAAITVKNPVERNYIFHLLKAKNAELKRQGTGSTFKAIGKNVLEDILVPIVSSETQLHITRLMDITESIISKRKKELKYYDELIKARFVEIFGDPVYNQMKWKTKALDDICKIIVDCPHSTPQYTNDDTGYMCIRTSIVKKNRILWDEIEYISQNEYLQRIQRKKPEKGDVIYTREGAILGIAAVIDRDCDVALGQRSMLLSPDRTKCTSEFLSVAMNFDSFLNNALRGVSGSASPHINVGDIKSFKMILPPIEQQIEYSKVVSQINKSKSVVQKSLKQTQLLFDSLMQQYFG